VDNPLFLCPIASHRAFHPDGELAVARAAKAGKHLVMLATPSTTSVEEVSAARGEPSGSSSIRETTGTRRAR